MPKRKTNHKPSPANHNQLRQRREKSNTGESQVAISAQQRITSAAPVSRVGAAWDFFSRAIAAPSILVKACKDFESIILAVLNCREQVWNYIPKITTITPSFFLRAWSATSRIGWRLFVFIRPRGRR